jgi:magnesium transporter
VWLDLVEPTPAEEKQVESFLSIDVPTRDEMREIEASNRLYEEDGSLVHDGNGGDQARFGFTGEHADHLHPVGRKWSPTATSIRCRSGASSHMPSDILTPAIHRRGAGGLLESVINRVADVIERVATDLDAASVEVFSASRRKRGVMRDFRKVLERLGQNGELISKARESLVQPRAPADLRTAEHAGADPETCARRFRTLSRDVLAMSDHASFLGPRCRSSSMPRSA